MALWKKVQHAFTAGQLDAFIMGRQDVERYDKGSTKLENFLVRRQGCITKRRGTDFVADLNGIHGNRYSAAAAGNMGERVGIVKIRLVPVVNDDNGRYIILSGGFGFVCDKHGILMRDGSHVQTLAPYLREDENGVPACLDLDEDEADNSLYPYRFVVPYIDAHLDALCIRQSGDTMFIAHRAYKPAAIRFDVAGFAHFGNLSFDNGEHLPPVIVSVNMEGQDAPECEYEFTESGHLAADENLGTVIAAGQTGPNTTTGPDYDESSATTWSLTYEKRDALNKTKTTTVVTKSKTTARSSILNSAQTATGHKDSSASSQSSAATTSPMIMKTIRYCATYVKDGKESRPSEAFEVKYCIPWQNSAIAYIEVDKGENADEPDYFNVYKDNGSGFGLIGSMKVKAADDNTVIGEEEETVAPGLEASVLPGSSAELYAYEHTPHATASFAQVRRRDLSSISNPESMLSGFLLSHLAQGYAVISDKSTAAKVASVRLEVNTYTTGLGGVYLTLDKYFYTTVSSGVYSDFFAKSCDRMKVIVYYEDEDGNEQSKEVVITATKAPGCTKTNADLTRDSAAANVKYWTSTQKSTTTYIPGGRKMTTTAADRQKFSRYARRINVDFARLGITDQHFIQNIVLEAVNVGDVIVISGAQAYAAGKTSADDGKFEDDYITPDMTLTPPVAPKEEHFNSDGNYPACVGIYEQRLVFASTDNYPSTIWLSRTADLYNFTAHDSIREDDAMELTLAATEMPRINHLVTGRDLMLFADGGEWIIKPISGNALTFKTASAKMQSAIGTSRTLEPIKLNDEVIIAERNGMHLRSSNYSYSSDSYKTTDISILAQDIFMNNPVVSMAYKQHPDSVIECVLADGTLATLVYMPEQDVIAWSRQVFGGGWKARQIATPKNILNGTTEMMLLMEREGAYQLWKVRDDLNTGRPSDEVTMDGCRAAESIENLEAGERGLEYNDNGEHKYIVGYPIVSNFVSVRPEPAQGQTAQFEIKNATEVEIRVIRASRFRIKPYNAGDNAWQTANMPLATIGEDARVKLYERDVKKIMVGTNNRDGRIHLEHCEPWPLTVLSLATTYQIQYENEPPQEGAGNA